MVGLIAVTLINPVIVSNANSLSDELINTYAWQVDLVVMKEEKNGEED